MPTHRPQKGYKTIRISYRTHYLLLSAMLVSNLAVFGLALLFTHTLLGEGLGYFVYLNEVKRLLNTRHVVASEQYSHGIDLDYTSFEQTWSEGALVVHPTNPNVIFRGTWGGGISKSSDSGRTWEYKNNGLASRFIGDIQFDPSNPSTMYAMAVGHLWSNGGGLYRSVDGGEYWEQVPGVVGGGTPFNINPCGIGEGVAIDPTNSNRLYIAMGINGCDVKGKLCGGFYSSEDAGATFNTNPGCQGQVVTNVYRSNDASIVRVHPTRTNEVYIGPGWGLHPEEESLATSHDYGATVKYEDVVDTRGSFLSSAEQYVMSLYPSFFDWAKANPEIRYAVQGDDLLKRRSDGKVLPLGCCGSGWDIPVSSIIVRYDGAKSQNSVDGVDDNDEDGDSSTDNIWKPIFATSMLPKLNPSWGGDYSTAYYTQSLMVDPVDPNKIYFTTYGWSMYILAINIWELTPGATPTDPWNYRSIYENRLTYPNLSSVRSITFDPSNRYRMYFVEMPWAPGVGPRSALSYVKKLESSDNGRTWQATTLASDYPYFHATDIKEFQTSSGSVIVMGSTNQLWAYTGGSWQARSSLFTSPQGFTFTSPVQSPHEPDSIYVKGPRFVAQSMDGARTFSFKQLDEIAYGLGESHPNATASDMCNATSWTAPVLTTTVFNALAVHPQDANTLFAGADNGLWKNTQAHPSGTMCYGPNSVVNASLAWTHIASTGLGNSFIWSLMFDPADATGATLWAGTRDGLYKSTNGGSSWRPALQNIKDVRQIEFGSGYMLIATLNGTYRSTDNGTNWNRVITQSTNRISHRLGNQLDWAAATSNGILKSNDGGSSWRQITAAFSGPIDAVLYTTSAGGLERFYYTGNGSGLYHTDIILSDITAPSAPTNLTATPTSQTQIDLNWERVRMTQGLRAM